MRLRDIAPGNVPYISPTDLIVFKIFSCGLRPTANKRRVDAIDAQNLMLRFFSNSVVNLTGPQANLVSQGLGDLVAYGTMTEQWWRQHLGLASG